MRGKAPSLAVLGACIGITPAYAGKSTDLQRPRAAQQDHPRVCGEKLSGCVWQQACAGSPPRMRGKVSQPHYSTGRGGITPAYAGKSPLRAVFWCRHRDHPRVCGEKSLAFWHFWRCTGSPPRMRGKEDTGAPGKNWPGITPAYAGKRNPRSGHRSGVWDHPRVCGEKPARLTAKAPAGGSPPRMRGKEINFCTILGKMGITPAYAGKRLWFLQKRWCSWDHPRVCGEKYNAVDMQADYLGSPPRMRGKANLMFRVLRVKGITPAYAGKSQIASNPRRSGRDHPRVCGEKQ